MKTAWGITRRVWLIGPYAIKFPRIRYGWNKFLRGLLSNMTEAVMSPVADEYALAPTLFSIWGGWMNIQRRCEPLTDEEWDSIDRDDIPPCDVRWGDMDCDFKRDNFGTLNGRIVLLDYGELT